MVEIRSFKRAFLSIFIVVLFTGFNTGSCRSQKVRILILSGRNNHDWQSTTPELAGLYENSGCFLVEISNRPDTLVYADLENFDVILSNWNTWPDNDLRLPATWENDFTRFVKEGGGLIFFHAGASSFYGWDDYHRIGIGRWGKETKHGKMTEGLVSEFNTKHPVTSGLKEFSITDEIWEKTDIFPGSKVLATLSTPNGKDGGPVKEPAVLVTTFGRGRSFYTTMGHNAVVLQNPDLRKLFLRAAQWVAGRRVTF